MWCGPRPYAKNFARIGAVNAKGLQAVLTHVLFVPSWLVALQTGLT